MSHEKDIFQLRSVRFFLQCAGPDAVTEYDLRTKMTSGPILSESSRGGRLNVGYAILRKFSVIRRQLSSIPPYGLRTVPNCQHLKVGLGTHEKDKRSSALHGQFVVPANVKNTAMARDKLIITAHGLLGDITSISPTDFLIGKIFLAVVTGKSLKGIIYTVVTHSLKFMQVLC